MANSVFRSASQTKQYPPRPRITTVKPHTYCVRCDGNYPGPRTSVRCPLCGCESPQTEEENPSDQQPN